MGGSPLPPLLPHRITHLEKGSVGILAKSGFNDSLPPGTQGAGLRDKVGTSLGGGPVADISQSQCGGLWGVQWLTFHNPNVGALGSTPGQGTRSHMPQ